MLAVALFHSVRLDVEPLCGMSTKDISLRWASEATVTLSPVVRGSVGRVFLTVDRCAGPGGGPGGAGLLVLGTVCFATRGDVRSGKCGGRDGGDGGEGIASGMGPRGVAGRFGVGGGIMRMAGMGSLRVLLCEYGGGVGIGNKKTEQNLYSVAM